MSTQKLAASSADFSAVTRRLAQDMKSSSTKTNHLLVGILPAAAILLVTAILIAVFLYKWKKNKDEKKNE